MIAGINHGDERQLLKIAQGEGDAEIKLQHAEDVKQEQKRWLKGLLETFEEKNIADTEVCLLYTSPSPRDS